MHARSGSETKLWMRCESFEDTLTVDCRVATHFIFSHFGIFVNHDYMRSFGRLGRGQSVCSASPRSTWQSVPFEEGLPKAVRIG
jgi:hypothetical protein